MPKNIGNTDKIIRVIIAVVFTILIFTITMSSTLKIILGIFAIISLVTSITGTCMLYIPFKFSTNKKKTE